MATRRLVSVLRYLHSRVGAGANGGQGSDRQLLERFARERDQAAFAALMHRHGPLVLGVCRRVLWDANDADDAFQATFLVLVRKAASIGQPELLGNWLYGVAYRTAVRVRLQTAARHRRERCVMQELAAPPVEDAATRELRQLLDEELDRLPERYRRPFVLCHLCGLSNEEAARRLGCPKGTVLSRLSRARERLRHGLERRGVTMTATALTALLADSANAAVPIALFESTVASALLFSAGQAAATGMIGAPAAVAEGVLQSMFLTKLKIGVAVLLLMAVAGSGAGMLVFGTGSSNLDATADQPDKPKDKSAGTKDDKKKLQPAANPKVRPPLVRPMGPSRAQYHVDRLASLVDFEGLDDPKTTLQDALDYLVDRYDVAFEVNEPAFMGDGLKNSVLSDEVAAHRPIHSMRNVSFDTVLRKILERVDVKNGGATYIVRRNFIELTTRTQARLDAFRDWSVNVPLTNAVFVQRPLNEALEVLTASSGVSLVIDGRTEEKAKTPVTATLTNLPLDTAVRVLADMADLQPAFLDNVIYLTTRENAKRLEQESKKRPAPMPAAETK